MFGFQQGGIGGYAVALVQQYQVARHQLAAGYAQFLSVAQHQGSGRRHAFQGFEGLFGFLRLVKGDKYDEQGRRQQYHTLAVIAQHHIQGGTAD